MPDSKLENSIIDVAVLGGYTTAPIVTAIRCAACAEDRMARVYEAPFRTFRQEIMDPSSGLYAGSREVVILALNAINLDDWPGSAATREQVDGCLDAWVKQFVRFWDILRERLGCSVWQHTFEPSGQSHCGLADRAWAADRDSMLARLNERLLQVAPSYVRWIDCARLAVQVGIENWFDRRLYFHGKYGFQPRFLDSYLGLLSGVLRQHLNRRRKALVVDLDNTLWGGVIGDDGLDRIVLGDGSATGEAFADFCHYLKELGRRGILLGVCSKNDPNVAEEVFNRHPQMPLRPSDFSSFHCSWGDKVHGLRTVAQELNIGLDHLVFADDNPAECELVRQQLPEVAVVQLDGDPSLFPGMIARGHWFDADRLSREDQLRAASYHALRKAEEVRDTAVDLESYLKGLQMVAACGPARESDLPRLAQMEGKTNQFNLTTRRYDELRLHRLLTDPQAHVMVCRLRDRFADHGLVSSAVLMREADGWRIDSWLMSCRVFSRTLEHLMLHRMVEFVSRAGGQFLKGEYFPTERNGVVKELFPRLGFVACAGDEPGRWWRLNVSQPGLPQTYVQSVPNNANGS